MTRRTIVAALWFMAVALACEVLWSIGLTPRPLGLIVATAVAGFVWLDPMRQFHPRTDRRTEPAVRALPVEARLLPR